jgi:hypothetical protein
VVVVLSYLARSREEHISHKCCGATIILVFHGTAVILSMMDFCMLSRLTSLAKNGFSEIKKQGYAFLNLPFFGEKNKDMLF